MAGIVTTPLADRPGRSATSPVFANGKSIQFWFGTIAFDDSYPTGGEAWDPVVQTGMRSIQQVWVMPYAGYTFQYVPSATAASRKIKAFWVDTSTDGAAQAEVADTTSLAALTAVPVFVVGYR